MRFPTSRERRGDFSQTFNAQGQLVVIHDPLTGDANGNNRQPFPANIIPDSRINNVARGITGYLPMPDRDVSDGNHNFTRTAEIHDRAIMYTGKVDHRFSDRISLSGFYLYNKTSEPDVDFWEPGGTGANRFADPSNSLLQRRVHVLALNNTWLPSNNTVVTLRYGYTRFIDDDTLTADFDPSTLGFSSNFLSATQIDKFPQIRATDYDGGDLVHLTGAFDPTNRNWHSWGFNGALTRLVGRHTLKFGADFRWVGLDFQSFRGTSGDFRFDRYFTSSDPLTNGTATSGNAFASFLLGYPSGARNSESTTSLSTPLRVFAKYYGAYAQDDFRVSPKLTFNYGLRLEHQDGLREKNNGFTVGFDRTLTPPGPLGNVIVNGNPVRGGVDVRRRRRREHASGRSASDQGLAPLGRRLCVQSQYGHSQRVRDLLGAQERAGTEHDQLWPGGIQPGDADPAGTVLPYGDADRPLSQRAAAADRQFAGRADQRGRADRVRRSNQHGA